MEKNKSYHKTIWFVNQPMLVKEKDNKRKVLIEKGEIIEFRFHNDMNFRTLDNKYFCTDEETWNNNCIEIGTIWERVSFNNVAELDDIMKLSLFDKNINGWKIYQNWLEED